MKGIFLEQRERVKEIFENIFKLLGTSAPENIDDIVELIHADIIERNDGTIDSDSINAIMVMGSFKRILKLLSGFTSSTYMINLNEGGLLEFDYKDIFNVQVVSYDNKGLVFNVNDIDGDFYEGYRVEKK